VRPDRTVPARKAAGLLLAATLGACVSSSTERDLRTVRALAHVDALPALHDDAVEPQLDAQTRARLDRPLDVEAAVRIALLGNRALRAKLRELGVARAALIQAAAIANPVVGAELPAERDADLELHVEYEISSLLVASLRADAAEAELERARLSAAAATVALGHEVRSSLPEARWAPSGLKASAHTQAVCSRKRMGLTSRRSTFHTCTL
jgi:hypothetical protein